MKQLLVPIILLLIVAACSPTPTTNTTTAPTTVSGNADTEPTPTREGDTGADISGDPGSSFGFGDMLEGDGFAAVVSGGNVALEFNNAGYFGCENGNTYAIRPTVGGLPLLSIIIPADLAAGTYTIGDRNITASVVTANNSVYAGILNGVLVLETVATASGQRVTGNFDFDVTNGSNTVNAQGEFDFVPASGTTFC